MERLREINALVERCAHQANARYAGRTEEVLAEGINPKDPSQLMGRTRTNRLTFFSATGPMDTPTEPAISYRCASMRCAPFHSATVPCPLNTTLIPLALPLLRGRSRHRPVPSRSGSFSGALETRRFDPIRGDRRPRPAQRAQHRALHRAGDLHHRDGRWWGRIWPRPPWPPKQRRTSTLHRSLQDSEVP